MVLFFLRVLIVGSTIVFAHQFSEIALAGLMFPAFPIGDYILPNSTFLGKLFLCDFPRLSNVYEG